MELTQQRVRELFDYREDGVLIAKERAKGRKFGKPVGCLSDGYLVAMVCGKSYKVHRLVFLWHHGYMPAEVDHHDLNRSNNRISNLRPAERNDQSANCPMQSNNTSGFKGVTWEKRRHKWVAQIMVGRKHLYLGQFSTKEEAHAAYVKAAHAHFGEFARAA